MSIRTPRGSTRFGVAAIAAALIASLFAFASPAGAAQNVTTSRIAGVDRYDTAARIAAGTATGSEVILVSGENFPDGLAAAALAGALDAPILLTAQAGLPSATSLALGEIQPSRIHVIGGTAAISQNVRDQLTGFGFTLNEISGADRAATAAAVSAYVRSSAGVIGSFNGKKTAVIATGTNFPDALTAGALAAKGNHPILLTDGGLPAATQTELITAGIKHVVIMGGTAAVSEATENAIKALGITTQRVAGADRGETAVELAKVLTTLPPTGFGFNRTGIVLVNSATPWDALPAGPFAASLSAGQGQPILLAGSAATTAYLEAAAAGIQTIGVLGGTAAVSAADLNAAKDAATTKTPDVTIEAYAGSTGVKVTFSEKVEDNGSITVTGGKTATLALASDGKSGIATVYGGALAAGDTITVAGYKTPATAGVRVVAPASFTVGADAKGTGTITAQGGHSSFTIKTSRSAVISTVTVNGSNTNVSSVTSSNAPFDTEWTVTLRAPLAVGDKIAATAVTTGVAAITIPTVTITSTDTTKPTVVAAYLGSTASTATAASVNVDGAALVTARSAGIGGNNITVVVEDAVSYSGAAATPHTVTVNDDEIKIVRGNNGSDGPAVITGSQLATAIQADLDANALVVVTDTNTDLVGNDTYSLTGGSASAVVPQVTVVFSEPVESGSATTLGNYGLDLAGNGNTIVPATVASQIAPNTVRVTFASGPAAIGVSQLRVQGVTDLATPPNAMLLSAVTVTAAP